MVTVPQEQIRFREDEEIVLPTAFRETLGLRQGDTLTLWEDAEGIHLQNRREAMDRAQAMMGTLYEPGRQVVVEFIGERRAEAMREEQSG
jgi:bifunctional DNA-binding transcriptional regulator/antitoxin component of YhaV-PrlF toxin-antitoxin module